MREHAEVCTRYGPSEAWIALNYDHDSKKKTIRILVAGSAKELRSLLPPGSKSARIVSPKHSKATIDAVEESKYAVVSLPRATESGVTDVTVSYRSAGWRAPAASKVSRQPPDTKAATGQWNKSRCRLSRC